jgi:MFS family permease
VRLLGVIFLVHSSFAILSYYSPPLLTAAGFDRKWIGPLQSLGVAVEVPFFFLLPRAILRLGYRATIGIGCAALLARQLCYALPSPLWLLAGSYVLVGICVPFYLIASSLALNAAASREVRATAQSFYVIAGQGLGQMVGHRVAGVLADLPGAGLTAVFSFATVTPALALLLLAFRKGGQAPRAREAA